MVSRIYVEKKPGFDVEAHQLLAELRTVIAEGLPAEASLRIVNVYDVESIDEALFERCVPVVFSEPQVDTACRELAIEGVTIGAAGTGEGISVTAPGLTALRRSPASLTSAPTPPPSACSSSPRASARPCAAPSST